MWKECTLKIKALERELLGTRCVSLINSPCLHLWQREKEEWVWARWAFVFSTVLFWCTFLLSSSAQTFTAAQGVFFIETACLTSSPRLLWGGFVTGFLLKLQLCKSHLFSVSWASFLLLFLRRIARSRWSGWSRNWEMFINTCFECVLLQRI